MEIRELLQNAENGSQFFGLYFQAQCAENPGFSVRKMSESLGYANPSLVSEIIRGKRKATFGLFHKFVSVRKLDPLEDLYLQNLIHIENSRSKSVIQSRRLENSYIRDLWKVRNWSREPGRIPVDGLVEAHVGLFSEGVSRDQVARALERIMDRQTVFLRIEAMIGYGCLLERENLIFRAKTDTRHLYEIESYRSLFPVLNSALALGSSKCKQTVIGVSLTPENYRKAKELVRGALEKVILLSIEEDQGQVPSHERAIYAFYSSFFQATETEAPREQAPG